MVIRMVQNRNFLSIILFVSLVVYIPSAALTKTQVFETKYYKVLVDLLADNLDHPWGLAFLPDDTPLITERSGKLKLISPDGGWKIVAGIPKVWAEGQGGLLDVAIHPRFSENRIIYFSYSEPSKDGRTAGTALAYV